MLLFDIAADNPAAVLEEAHVDVADLDPRDAVNGLEESAGEFAFFLVLGDHVQPDVDIRAIGFGSAKIHPAAIVYPDHKAVLGLGRKNGDQALSLIHI